MAKDLEAYISDAMNGFLAQQTEFPFEVVLSDDSSSDGTLGVVSAYQAEHPDIVRILTSERRLGLEENFIKTLNACTAKYVAFCDGDDFWTDPLKLQLEVEYLEAHEDCVLVCSDYDFITTAGVHEVSTYKQKHYDTRFSLYDELDESIATTLTVVCRKAALEPLLAQCARQPHPFIWDTVLWAFCLQSGEGYFLPRKTAIRRVLPTGEYTSRKEVEQLEITRKCLLSLEQVIGDDLPREFLRQKVYQNAVNRARLYFNESNKRRAIRALAEGMTLPVSGSRIYLDMKCAYYAARLLAGRSI